MVKTEMVIDSLRVSLLNYQRVIILKEKDGERYLPIWIGALEANAIAVKLQNVYAPESLTHDFVCSIIESLGAVLKYVIVYELTGDRYHAKALLKRENKVIEIDCRPSDAFATAIRTGAPIFVTGEILKTAGITISEISKINEFGKEPRARILVVDDEERHLQFVSNLLTGEGHEVDTAVDGIDALAKIKRNRYSLLLIGIRMPYMNGFEFYKHVQEIAPSLAKKTIVVSGSVEDPDTQEFLAKNKLTCMTKPFGTEQLISEVYRVLASSV